MTDAVFVYDLLLHSIARLAGVPLNCCSFSEPESKGKRFKCEVNRVQCCSLQCNPPTPHMNTGVCARAHAHTHTHKGAHRQARTRLYTYTHISTHMYTHTHTHTQARTHTPVHLHTQKHTHVSTHTHTHTHTHHVSFAVTVEFKVLFSVSCALTGGRRRAAGSDGRALRRHRGPPGLARPNVVPHDARGELHQHAPLRHSGIAAASREQLRRWGNARACTSTVLRSGHPKC